MALFVLMAVPAGAVQAQEVTYAGSGTAIISNDKALSDAITYSMTGVSSPGANMVYEGWLVSDDGSVKLSTGVMTLGDDGSIAHTYSSPNEENLILNYDTVLITVEPEADGDPSPSRVIAFSHAVPSGAMSHIRHLLAASPTNADRGILTSLQDQIAVATLHAELARNSDDIDTIKQELDNVIESIEGSGGVLTHAVDRKHAGFASNAALGDAVVNTHADLVDMAGSNVEAWATAARDAALDIKGRDNFTVAKTLLITVTGPLDAALNGITASGTGGAKEAYTQAQLMATYTLASGTTPEPGPGLPLTGDPTLGLLAQLSVITSLILLSGGLALILGRSRSRIIT